MKIKKVANSHACNHVQIGLEYDFHDAKLGIVLPSSCVSGLPGQGESTYTCTMAKQFCNVDISLYSFVKWSRVVNVPDIHVRAALEYDINILGIVLPCAIVSLAATFHESLSGHGHLHFHRG